MAKDIKDYILDCYKYAKYGTAIRNQILLLVHINSPRILLGMDFIGPFRKTPLTRSNALKIYWPILKKVETDEGFDFNFNI